VRLFVGNTAMLPAIPSGAADRAAQPLRSTSATTATAANRITDVLH
jgi:hypothetical protein